MAMAGLISLWDTARLRLIVEVERRGSISAAAAAVGIGQPSASEHLRLLEAAAGEQLVERSGRGSTLTEAGRAVAARASQALAALAAADEELAELAGLQRGTMHLGASTVPGVYLLPDALGAFRARFPNVTVEVDVAPSHETLRRLRAGRVQLALVGLERSDDRVILEPFLDDELVGIAKPGLLAVDGGLVRPRELARHTLLAREPDSAQRELAEAALAAADVRTDGVWELGSTEAMKRAARAGLGFAFLSRYAVAEEVARGELAVFRIRGRRRITRRFCVARLAGRPLSPAEREFVETLRRSSAAVATRAAEQLADADYGSLVPSRP